MRAVLGLIALTTLLRIALGGFLGLSVDESYTVALARHWALSYFDHPPLHVWLVGAWAKLCGSEQPLLLRVPYIALFALSTWLMYRLTALLYGARAGVWAALALNLAPLFTLNAAAGVLPDGPLVAFSLLSVLCFAHAVLPGLPGVAPELAEAAADASDRAREPLTATPGPSGRWMLAAGAAAGLALLSKYTAVFLVGGLALYLATCRPRWLTRPVLWLAVLLAALLCTPVLLWNHAHGWVSLAFQGGRALPGGFSAARAAIAFAAQLLYLLPWLGAALLLVLLRALRRGPRDARAWLFACLATGPIAAFSLIGLWAKVLPHWAAIGWLFTFPLLGERLASLATRRPRVLYASAAASAVVLLALLVLFAVQTATGGIARFVPSLNSNDPTLDFVDWRALRPAVAQLRSRNPELVVAAVSWIDAGKADYALGGTVPVLCLSNDPRGFAFIRNVREFAGRDALIVAPADRPDWLTLAAPHFRKVVPGRDVIVKRGGAPALTLHTAYGYGFRY
jgi:4-amino-4-deoxy-L-arabinose transferase-like glycosyltransferase